MLNQARLLVDSVREETDNESQLIKALRMTAGVERSAALSAITDRHEHIIRVCENPTCTHKQRCCCCGCETEIDLTTGIRVTCDSDRKPHYVCTNLLVYIAEIEKRTTHPLFHSVFKKLLLNVHLSVNSNN